jgi:hypothetical protein
MAIDFPDSPSVGDQFVASGKTYQWDGTVWTIYGPQTNPDIFKVDTTNNRVGINNASPSVTLDVTGDVSISGKLDAPMPVSTKTASYTLAAGDEGTRIAMNNAGATAITVNDAVFSAGDTVWLHNIGAGTCTVTAGTATVNTAASLDLAQWEGGSLYFTSASSAIFFRGAGGLDVFAVEYLVVGGGGGASTGAGGAGGMLTGTAYLELGGVTLTVGAGGAAISTSRTGVSGGDSRLANLIAVGGGGGGNAADGNPGKGGSGGSRYRAIQSGQIGYGIDGQGNDGGVGDHAGLNSGGGGGAGAVGQDSPSGTVAGNGGDGLTTTIISTAQATSWSVGEVSGSDLYFAGGGGGGEDNAGQTAGTGGLGGGGDGANNAGNGTNGTANTGGGAGVRTANGGSGVVILKWLTADASISVGVGLTSVNTTVGDYTVYAFTAGTDTVTFS